MSQIITTSDLNTYARKTLDAGLSAQIVAGVNDYIEGETLRCWGETKTVTNEYHNFGENLWLQNMDLQTVTSITLGWPQFTQTTLPSSGYFWNPYGRVTLFWQTWGGSGSLANVSKIFNDYISVSYTYGQLNVPGDLKDAALGTAMNFYNWAYAGGHEVVSTSIGSFRQEYAAAVRGASTGPTPWKDAAEAHFRTIKRYRKPRV